MVDTLQMFWDMAAANPALLKLAAAFVMGGLIGLEREVHGRFAGFRTHILVCVSATLIMIVSERMYVASAHAAGALAFRMDPGRIAAGIVTGIGFLGAGTIIRHENLVRGLTTAACIWLAASLGIAIGMGYIALALGATALALFCLVLLGYLERLFRRDRYNTLTVTAHDSEKLLDSVRQLLESRRFQIRQVEVERDVPGQLLTLWINVKHRYRRAPGQELTAAVARMEGVQRVRWG
jgi:putative Mg2+ transporter-C (MgtC) family protein